MYSVERHSNNKRVEGHFASFDYGLLRRKAVCILISLNSAIWGSNIIPYHYPSASNTTMALGSVQDEIWMYAVLLIQPQRALLALV